MPFSDVCHQAVASERIRRALQSGRMPHAYLFTGRPGIGRQMFAERLAQYLLCAERRDSGTDVDSAGLFMSDAAPQPSIETVESLDACGRCEDCALFTSGSHPDFHPIYRGLNRYHPDKQVQKRKAIEHSVDVIRHFVLEVATKRPSRGRAKAFIVTEAERLSIGAQNAMLKTLEEPPGHSYLILIATSADELLATTRSRCHHVPFNGLPMEFIVARLHETGDVDVTASRFLAALSQGSLGEAMRLSRGGVFGHVPALLESLRRVTADPLGASRAWQELAKTLAAGGKIEADDEEDADDAAEVLKSRSGPSRQSADADLLVESDDDDEEMDTGPDVRSAREGQMLLLSVLGALLGDGLRVSVGVAPVAVVESSQVALLAGVSAAKVSPRRMGEAVRAIASAERQLEMNANVGLVFDALAIAMSRALGTRAA